jgi:hypothetical protein
MHVTNYDTSSTGVDLELYCCRDGDAARFWFEDELHVLQHSGYREGSVLFAHLGTEATAPDSLSDCYDFSKATRKEIRAYCIEEYGETARDAIEERLLCYNTWTDFAEELLNEAGWDEVSRNGFPAIGNALLYTEQDITGYSQGDTSTVVYDDGTLAPGTDMRKYFENLVYNAPCYCRLTVDGEEYYLEEHLSDLYEWNEEEILQCARSNGLPESVIDWLQDNLPECPEYVS